MDPRANGRVKAIKDVSSGMELQLCGVIVVCRPHRANDCEVISTASNMRPPVTDMHAGLSAALKADLQWVQLRHQGPRCTGEVADIFAVER